MVSCLHLELVTKCVFFGQSYHQAGVVPVEVGLKRGNNSVCLSDPGNILVLVMGCSYGCRV